MNSALSVTEFEFHLWRVFYAFLRWQEQCEKSVSNVKLTGYELSILHVIRINETPKNISDIANVLNRDDHFNLAYSIKKLLKMGLIKKYQKTQKGGHAYQITKEGIENIEAYACAKKTMLLPLFSEENNLNLEEIAAGLIKIKMFYEEASRKINAFNAEKAMDEFRSALIEKAEAIEIEKTYSI